MEGGTDQPLFPWYKERLQTKYLKTSATKLTSFTSYKVTDDYSPALPWTQEDISQVPRQPISKQHACFSRQMIQKLKRKEYVAAVEDKLRQPLAQYQQYKDYMPAELIDKVLLVLYPDAIPNKIITKNMNTLSLESMVDKDEKNHKE